MTSTMWKPSGSPTMSASNVKQNSAERGPRVEKVSSDEDSATHTVLAKNIQVKYVFDAYACVLKNTRRKRTWTTKSNPKKTLKACLSVPMEAKRLSGAKPPFRQPNSPRIQQPNLAKFCRTLESITGTLPDRYPYSLAAV